ncbi:MAG: hypothetical protein AB1324_08480 [Candidatus Micrarchaeota archaeon]
MAQHVRLLFPNTVRQTEVAAARSALESFGRFGVTHDSIQVDAAPGGMFWKVKHMEPVRKVKHGEKIHSIITNPGAVVVGPLDLQTESISCLWHDKDILGVGLTPWRIHEAEVFPDEKSRRLGLSLFGHGALVSLFMIRELGEGVRESAITLAIKHEVGHVFINRKGHCGNAGCLMQENENSRDFVERFVLPALDFCRECREEIGKGIAMLEAGRYN